VAEELRKIVSTVGKPGEHIRCVVSVAMLNEGWDANNVTRGYREPQVLHHISEDDYVSSVF